MLNKVPPKRVAASKKKELSWMDNEAELLLPQAEQSGCIPFLFHVTRWPVNHVSIG